MTVTLKGSVNLQEVVKAPDRFLLGLTINVTPPPCQPSDRADCAVSIKAFRLDFLLSVGARL